MGLIRGGLLVLVSVLLFISLFFMGTFATLNLSLDYNNSQVSVHPVVREVVVSEVDGEIIKNRNLILNSSCLSNEKYSFYDSGSNYTFEVPCEVIANGSDAIIDYETDSLIERDYYKKYDCDFWKCFKQEKPFFLVSQFAKDYWKSKFYTFLLVSILLAGLMFLLVKKKNNFPILTGFLLIISFVPVANLDSIGRWILKIIFSSMKGAVVGLSSIDLSKFVLIFFNRANDVFWKGFNFGIILIGIGILFKLIKVGFKVGDLFKFEWGNKKNEVKKIKENKSKKGELALSDDFS